MISEHLKSHPTTPETPKRLQIQGMPPQKEIIPPAIPRGFKIGTILPLHSPALSGGGVSENMFKDMVCTTFSQFSVPNYSSTSLLVHRGSFGTMWRRSRRITIRSDNSYDLKSEPWCELFGYGIMC